MSLKVLHCPTGTGGQAWYLSRAERRLGLESDVLLLKSHPFGYPADSVLDLKAVNPVSAAWQRFKTFRDAAERYDVFHFNYGSTLLDFPYLNLHHLDLPFLKRKGKKIFVTYQGCDIRLRSFCLKNFGTSVCHRSRHWHCSAAGDWIKRRRLEKVRRCADRIFVLNPDLLHVVPEASLEFYASLEPSEVEPREEPGDGVFRILHAPSNPEIKGTAEITAAVQRLQSEGFAVDLLLVQGKTHDEARKLYRKAHIAVDQLHAGWYGVFAVEAMSLGIPVLCYLRPEDLDKFVPFCHEIPIINTNSETIYEDMKRLVSDPVLRRKAALEGRDYVSKYHSPLRIAQRMLSYYGASREAALNELPV